MKPTVIQRASETKPTFLLAAYPNVTLPLDEQIRSLTAELNRIFAILNGRLEMLEQQLKALQKKG